MQAEIAFHFLYLLIPLWNYTSPFSICCHQGLWYTLSPRQVGLALSCDLQWCTKHDVWWSSWTCMLLNHEGWYRRCHLPASRGSSWEPRRITQVYISLTLLPLMLLHEIFIQGEAPTKRCSWKTNKSLNSNDICKISQIHQDRARSSTKYRWHECRPQIQRQQCKFGYFVLNRKVLSGANQSAQTTEFCLTIESQNC